MPDFFMNEHNNLNISQKKNSSLVGEKDADN